jgi:hypothetical protein
MSANAPPATSGAPAETGWLKELWREGILPAALAGAAVGLWAALAPTVRGDEFTILLATMGAAVGLLAVTLTAMTLVIVFLNDAVFRVLIAGVRVSRFFRPFVHVALVSAGAAVISLIGAIDSASGPSDPPATVHSGTAAPGPTGLEDILFGVSGWLLVWAILGVVYLVRLLVKWATTSVRLNQIGQ